MSCFLLSLGTNQIVIVCLSIFIKHIFMFLICLFHLLKDCLLIDLSLFSSLCFLHLIILNRFFKVLFHLLDFLLLLPHRQNTISVALLSLCKKSFANVRLLSASHCLLELSIGLEITKSLKTSSVHLLHFLIDYI